MVSKRTIIWEGTKIQDKDADGDDYTITIEPVSKEEVLISIVALSTGIALKLDSNQLRDLADELVYAAERLERNESAT